MVPRAVLLLVCACAADARTSYGLREREQLNCGFGHYGSRVGTAQRLVVTHLGPGVADWNIAVPMPPVCRNAQVTGVETAVCDADAPPDVTMSGLLKARVHRRGQLKGFAAVNVTVHCILRSDALDALALHHADTRSTYEVLSNELNSNELISTEVTSHESVSSGLTSNELFPNVVKLTLPATTTSTSTSPQPPLEVPTPYVELTTPPQQIIMTPSLTQSSQLKEKASSALKVTINIIHPSHDPTGEQNQLSNEANLPSLSYKERPQKAASSLEPELSTPPRLAGMSWRPPSRPPRRPGASPPWRPGASPPWRPGASPPRRPGGLPPRHRAPPAPPMPLPPPAPPAQPELTAVPALLDASQLLVTSLLRPVRLLPPRIAFLHRPAPLFIFRRF